MRHPLPRRTQTSAEPRRQELDLAIVVPSCDAYADIWPAFFETLFRRWPDCPFPIYLVSNHATMPDPRIRTLNVGEDRGWSTNLKAALASVPHERVFLIIDDLFPSARIDTAELVSVLEEAGDFDYLRLNPRPGPRDALPGRVGLVPPGDIYRTATVFSVWRREVLGDLLVEGETAWEFEIKGSERSDRHLRWFATRSWMMPYVNLVVKRKIDPAALRALEREGIVVRSPRERLGRLAALRLRLNDLRSWLFTFVPWRIQRRVRTALKG